MNRVLLLAAVMSPLLLASCGVQPSRQTPTIMAQPISQTATTLAQPEIHFVTKPQLEKNRLKYKISFRTLRTLYNASSITLQRFEIMPGFKPGDENADSISEVHKLVTDSFGSPAPTSNPDEMGEHSGSGSLDLDEIFKLSKGQKVTVRLKAVIM